MRLLFPISLLTLSLSCLATPRGYVLSMDEAPSKKHSKGAEVFLLASPEIHGNKSLFLSVLKVPAGGKVPEHKDPTEEYLYVLKGTGTLWIDDQEMKIGPRMVVYMPAGAKVRFQAGNTPVEVLQVFAPSGPEKKYKAWVPKKAKSGH